VNDSELLVPMGISDCDSMVFTTTIATVDQLLRPA